MKVAGTNKRRKFVCLFLFFNMVHFAGGRQSGAILYNAFGVMGNSDTGGQTGMSKSNGSTGSQTGSGYSTDMSDDNLPHDAVSPVSDVNEHSDSDEQVIC